EHGARDELVRLPADPVSEAAPADVGERVLVVLFYEGRVTALGAAAVIGDGHEAAMQCRLVRHVYQPVTPPCAARLNVVLLPRRRASARPWAHAAAARAQPAPSRAASTPGKWTSPPRCRAPRRRGAGGASRRVRGCDRPASAARARVPPSSVRPQDRTP